MGRFKGEETINNSSEEVVSLGISGLLLYFGLPSIDSTFYGLAKMGDLWSVFH